MISSEVQRTLVKSPPELWSEVSDEAALARHLHDFVDVRITRITAEERVDWEAQDARGSVVIAPSGWGTRVTLTLQREDAPPATPAQPPQSQASETVAQATAQHAAAQPVKAESVPPKHAVPPPAPAVASDTERDAANAVSAAASGPPSRAPITAGSEPKSSEPEVDAPEPVARRSDAVTAEPSRAPAAPPADIAAPPPDPIAPRRGILARVVSGWQMALAWAERPSNDLPHLADPSANDATAMVAGTSGDAPPATAPAVIAQAADAARESASSAVAADSAEPPERPGAEAEASLPPPAAPRSVAHEPRDAVGETGLSAELRAAEEAGTEGDTAVLTAVLDSLGSAHHRPFSRS